MTRPYALLLAAAALAGCSGLADVGRAPDFTPLPGSYQHHAIYGGAVPEEAPPTGPAMPASLWAGPDAALFEDGRARNRGDILTVMIDINDSAEFSATSDRTRSGSQTMGIPSLFGIPQRLNRELPGGASLAEAVETDSQSTFAGQGTTARQETLTLRVAATVVEVLPNGTLHIEGQQEVRLNNELRELIVSGYVRQADISRGNEVSYDRIAGARVSYGGRGLISEVQRPRWGQQASDAILPF